MGNEGKKMFRYSIKTHGIEEVFSWVEQSGKSPHIEKPTVLYCDTTGTCMLDETDAGSPYLEALQALLNEEAGKGKRLVQVLFREKQMITLWEERYREV